MARYNLRRQGDFLVGDMDQDEEKRADDDVYFTGDDEQGVCSGSLNGPLFSNSVERSAHMALSAAAAASSPSHGRNFVGVLRTAGFVLPPPSDGMDVKLGTNKVTVGLLSYPTFVPASHPSGKNNTDCTLSPKLLSGERRKRDEIDTDEVYEIIRNVRDPEHPLSLEQLGVVRRDHVSVVDAAATYPSSDEGDLATGGAYHRTFSTVDVRFTPTIPHCSMATLIGLCLRVKLLRSLPKRFKVTVRIEPGTHASETAVNRQLDDKERVCAALENDHLRGVVDRCIADGMRDNMSSG